MYKKLLNLIEEFDTITIFRHVRPDGDAMFSCLACYYFLKDNFKNKKIKIGGYDTFDLISKNDKISDKFVQNSLAIVFDCANADRIDDFRALAAKNIVKIDHHPNYDEYGDLNIVNSNSSSTCEVLSGILLSKDFKKYMLSDKVCKYLYCGILADTQNFKTTNTSSNTHLIASKLIEIGKIDSSELYLYLNSVDLERFKKITSIRNYLKIENNFGYIMLDKKQLNKLNISANDAKNNIDEFGSIKELNIWAFAVENENGWDCSLRSKKRYIINKIASQYKGGGHPNAAAVKGLKIAQIKDMFNELIELSTK